MKIGLFTDTYIPEINGVANSTHILFQELENRGHTVYVVTTGRDIDTATWDDGGKILRVSGIELKSIYGYIMAGPFHIHAMEEVKKLALDVIHAQTEFGVGIFAKIVSQQLRIPLVRTTHTNYENYTHYVNFFSLKAVDDFLVGLAPALGRLYGDSSQVIIAPSQKTKELLVNYGVQSDIYVVPTGLQLAQFAPEKEDPDKTEDIRRTYGFGDDDRIMIYVGRIAAEKSLDLILGGFKLAVQSGATTRLLIVGGGPDLSTLQKQVEKDGTNEHIRFTGPKPSAEVPDYYRAADAFVSASLSETQGMTFIEAMASGLPLFARRDDVLTELVKEDETGWYFDDAEDFASKIMLFEKMPGEILEKMGKAARDKVRPFNSDVFCDKVLEVYRRAVNDFTNLYRIDDIKVKDSTVYLYLIAESKADEMRIKVDIDDYYQESMRRGTILTQKCLARLKAKEAGVDAYDKLMRKLQAKDMTCKEVYDWLTKNTECSVKTANRIIAKLQKAHFIDDERYCLELVMKMNQSLYGEEKMIDKLKRKGFSPELIESCMHVKPEEEKEKALRCGAKYLNREKGGSLRKTQNNVYNKLVRQGYSPDIAAEVVNELNFNDYRQQEKENLRRCLSKAKERLSVRYEGYELRRRLFAYGGSRGYKAADINAVLDEMREEDNENQ